MKEFLKKNWQIVLVGFATLVLAVIALVTAWKLYQVGKEPIAPTAPISEPRADEDIPAATGAGEGEICGGLQGIACQPPLVCVYDGQTTTPPSEDATGTCATFDQEPTEPCVLEFTVEAPPILECWNECSPDEECPESLVCQDVDGTDRCVHPDCPEEEDCICPEELPGCYEECVDDCSGSLVCQDVDGTDLCVNEDCPEEEDCICPGESPTPTPIPTPTPTPSPSPSPSPSPPPPGSPAPSPSPSPAPEVELPEAGFISPTILATLGGIILILIGLLL